MLRDFPHGIKKLVFYSAMTLIVAVSLVISCLRQNVEHVFLCLLALLLFQLPNLLKRRLKLYILPIMEEIIVTFIGAVAFNLFAAIYSKKHAGFIFGLLIDTEEHTKQSSEVQNCEKKNYYN